MLHNRNCAVCRNHKIVIGYNDLAHVYPQIIDIWDFNLNPSPCLFSPKTKTRANFICPKNHKWESSILNVTTALDKNYISCPKCNNHTSFGEQAIYYYLQNIALNRYKYNKKEVDIFIPSLNIGIEFNGMFYHKDTNKDLIKELYLSNYMKMFYVLEGDDNFIKNNKVYFNVKQYNKNLEWAIKELFKMLNFNIKVDLKEDEKLIRKNYQ